MGLMGHQLGTTTHQRFAPLTPGRLMVEERWQGSLPATPC